ncbi:GMC oxidoreductase [Biscogniauxia sp. FL1348]|nr:GMC oxidoreductase [Biscogniauxia sp. FL1348]
MLRLSVLSTLLSPALAAVLSQLSGGRLTGNSFGVAGLNATYDYVIVGAGNAGAVVAARLTQNTNASVALIEAGSFYELSNGNWSQLPYWSQQWEGPDTDDWQPLVDWGYQTEPQIGGKTIHYAQGRTLGGSSARNQMMYNRPTKGAYQLWADMVGDEAYTWDNMLPFLERSMQFSSNSEHRPANATPHYNTSVFSETGGPLHVSYPGYVYPIASYGSKVFSSLGLSELPGFSTGVLQGWSWWQFTIDPNTGLRSSSESSFLAEAMGRPGLTTYVNSMARNIIFSNNTAVGVNVTNYGQRPFILSARKEVIVSAGLYNSPQLLMVSGVGPKETLDKFDIPVVADLQGVGKATRDSAAINGPIFEIDAISYGTWQQPDMLQQAIEQYYNSTNGPMTSVGIDIGAFEKLPASVRANLSAQALKDLADFPSDWPEVEYLLEGVEALSLRSDTSKSYATISVIMTATTSRGNMTIRSASNLDPPVINPNWLQNSTDREVALQAFRRARQAWKSIPISVGAEVFPGANVTTDADVLAAIEQNLVPTHHGTASCAMGKDGDPAAVVDSKGRVFGVQNLRVIDSSSMPFTPPGHSMGPTYAHAEKLTQDVVDAYLASV